MFWSFGISTFSVKPQIYTECFFVLKIFLRLRMKMAQYLQWSFIDWVELHLGQSNLSVITWSTAVASTGSTCLGLQLLKSMPLWRYFSAKLYVIDCFALYAYLFVSVDSMLPPWAGFARTRFPCSKRCGMQSALCDYVTCAGIPTVRFKKQSFVVLHCPLNFCF